MRDHRELRGAGCAVSKEAQDGTPVVRMDDDVEVVVPRNETMVPPRAKECPGQKCVHNICRFEGASDRQ